MVSPGALSTAPSAHPTHGVAGESWFLTQRDEDKQVPLDEPSAPAGTQPLRSVLHKLSPVPFPDIPPGRRSVWGDLVPAPCPVPPARNKPKAQILPGGDGREALACSRSFGASISSAVSGARVTGPPTNLLSPAFPSIAAGMGSPPAAFPAVLRGLAANRRELLSAEEGIFREEEQLG